MDTSAPVSLYLDLKDGETADIDVVARAALAWSAAIKELSYIVDPSIKVQVDIVSGTPGSLGINACIKAIGSLPGKYPKLTTIVLTSLTWFALETASWSYENVLDWLTGKDAPAAVRQLSKEEIGALAAEIYKAGGQNVAAQQRQQIYRELEKDSAVTGVGATQEHGHRPTVIVPRSEFPARAGDASVSRDDGERRTTRSTLALILVSPTLKDAERSWKLQQGSMPEFGATMKDHAFLAALAAGRVTIPLRAGVEMTVELETKEEFEGGVWVAKERSIVKVLHPSVSDDPSTLPFPPRKPQ